MFPSCPPRCAASRPAAPPASAATGCPPPSATRQPGGGVAAEAAACVGGGLMPPKESLAMGGLPIGLASRVPLIRDVKAGDSVTWSDVRADQTDAAYRYRRGVGGGVKD